MSNLERKRKLPKTELPPNWIVLNSKKYQGKQYYFNTLTKVSSWTHPLEMQPRQSKNLVNIYEVSTREKKSIDFQHATQKSKSTTDSSINSSSQVKQNESTNKAGNSKYQEKYSATPDTCSKKILVSDCSKAVKTIHSTNVTNAKKTETKDCKSGQLYSCDNSVVKGGNASNRNKYQSCRNSSSSSSALDLIKSSYQDETNLAQKRTSTREKILKEKGTLLEAQEKRKKKRKKKSKASLDSKIELKKKEQLNLAFLNATPVKFEKFKIPHKNYKSEIVLKSNSHLESQTQQQNTLDNDTKLSNTSTFNNDSFTSKSCSEDSYGDLTSGDDFIEEMDWEPCDEETEAKNINEFRQQMDISKTITSDIFYQVKPDNIAIQSPHSWVLILDTNIFISCLSFVKGMRNYSVPGLGYPIFYIPWRVLQELDHLKNIRTQSSDKSLPLNARKAISYLNENFKSNHSRFCGQTLEDFSKVSDENSTPDDEILKTCLQIKNSYNNVNVILLTNDKNLESKAHVCNIETYSKEGFQTKYLSSKNEDSVMKSVIERNNMMQNIDNIYCEFTNMLKEFFSVVIETEMKDAFDKDWLKICFRKPPWSLRDTMDIFKKHWVAVFFLVLDKVVLTEMEILYLKLFKRKIDLGTVSDLVEVIEIAQELLESFKKGLKKERFYKKSVDDVSNAISDLKKKICCKRDIQVNDEGMTSKESSINENSMPNQAFSARQTASFESFNDEFNQIKDIFKWIWDSLKNFCDTLSTAFTSSSTNNNLLVPETKLDIMQRHRELSKLIAFLEQGLGLNVQDISRIHPVISQFSDFLVQALSVTDPKLQMNMPKCLAVFLSSSEGRNLLTRSLDDFREFSQTLLRANEFIDRSCCSV